MKFRILYNLLTNHAPEIGPTGDSLERIKFTKIIFIIIFAERHLAGLHLLLLFIKASDDVLVLKDSHRHVYDVDVIDVGHLVFGVFIIKLKIGVNPPF